MPVAKLQSSSLSTRHPHCRPCPLARLWQNRVSVLLFYFFFFSLSRRDCTVLYCTVLCVLLAFIHCGISRNQLLIWSTIPRPLFTIPFQSCSFACSALIPLCVSVCLSVCCCVLSTAFISVANYSPFRVSPFPFFSFIFIYYYLVFFFSFFYSWRFNRMSEWAPFPSAHSFDVCLQGDHGLTDSSFFSPVYKSHSNGSKRGDDLAIS